jgi:MFS family permease
VPALAEFRALDKRIWYLAGVRLVVTGGFSMVIPLLAMYVAIDRGQPAVVVGLIWTIAGAAGAAMQWVAGELADRVGRRPVMVAAMFVRALNLTALGYTTGHHSSVVIIAGLIVANSMLRAFFDPVANALIADVAPPEQRVAAFSLQRVGLNIGWAVGNTVGALFAAHYSTLFYFSAAITLVSTLALRGLAEPHAATMPRRPHWRELIAFRGDKPFLRFLLATLAFFVLQVQLYSSLSIYAARVLHLGRSHVASLYALNGIMVVFLQIPAASFIQRVGTRRALFLGGLGYAASYAAVGLTSGLASMFVCVAAITLAEIITAPAQQATVPSLAPTGRIGAYSGLYGLCQVVGQSAGPLIGTSALDAVPPRAAWFLLALFGAAAAFIYHSVLPTRARPQ